MAASSVTVRPSPIGIARAVGAAVPAEVSAQPLLGILGVVLGAGVVTLTSRMISLGMPDFRGLHGFGYDESAWIGSAFDAGLMFILTLLSGLASGTFYPLTLTFALRNIPLRYLPFTLALYATFVDGAVNIAPSLYGWYREHLSSNWMFWNSALITPLMMICIYYGIPKTKSAKKAGKAPSFAGFLYASASFFLVCALVGRLRGPNALVALPYLLKWNTILLGCLLFWFRFTLCTTIILIPQSLAIRGFEADQIGPAIIWSAFPLVPVACTAALLLLRKFDPRLLLAIGLACTAFSALLNSQYSSTWAAENFYRTELLTGVWQAFAFIG